MFVCVRLRSVESGRVTVEGHIQGRGMIVGHRRQLIAERIRAAGSVTVAELEREFGVSSMTARRDLQTLERLGQARRTHGGAVLPAPAREEDTFASRLDQAPADKDRLAAHAAGLVGEGETVFVDSSTTAYLAVRRLLDTGRRLTIITNSVPVMDLVARSDAPGVDLVGLTGNLRRLTSSFVGPQTIRAAREHFADTLLFSVNGVSESDVLTDADPHEAEVKRAMLEQTVQKVLLVDGSKLRRAGLIAIAPVTAVTRMLVAGGSSGRLSSVVRAGVEVEEV